MREQQSITLTQQDLSILTHYSISQKAHLLKTQWWVPLLGHLATHGWDHCGLVRWHLGDPARAKEDHTKYSILKTNYTGCDLFHKGVVTLAKFKRKKGPLSIINSVAMLKALLTGFLLT